MEHAAEIRLIRLPEVKSRTGLSRSTIYLRIKEGKFPAPISLGMRAVGWLEFDIQQWLDDRIKISRPDHIDAKA